MSSRSLDLKNILYGPGTLEVNLDAVEKLILNIPDLKVITDGFSVKKIREEQEVVNGQELPFTVAQEASLEFLYDELQTADLELIDDGDEIVITSSKGGLNSTGILVTMAICDIVYAEAAGFKTKIVARKTAQGDSLSDIVTITDNDAV